MKTKKELPQSPELAKVYQDIQAITVVVCSISNAKSCLVNCKKIILACYHCNEQFSECNEQIVCVKGAMNAHYCHNCAIELNCIDE